MQFIIKLFPEIIIKSKPVRKQMIRRLKDNLYALLCPLDSHIRVHSRWDKMTVETAL